MKKYLVLDMGGTSVKYGILKENGDILEKSSFKTPETLEAMYEEIGKVVATYENISGIALSCPGAVNSDTGIIGGCSAIPYIHGPNLKKELERMFGLKVEIENDANCAALAEVWLGEAKENEDVVFIVLGTGVGGAIVKDRKVHKGKNLHAGEFGIMYFETEKGVPGAWGAVSTGQLCLRMSQKFGYEVDGVEVFKLAEVEKNPIAVEEVKEWYRNIAKGIITIQYVYDPEKIIIGGGISEKEGLIENINRELIDILKHIPVATIVPEVKKCKFNNDSNLIGALYNFIQRNN